MNGTIRILLAACVVGTVLGAAGIGDGRSWVEKKVNEMEATIKKELGGNAKYCVVVVASLASYYIARKSTAIILAAATIMLLDPSRFGKATTAAYVWVGTKSLRPETLLVPAGVFAISYICKL